MASRAVLICLLVAAASPALCNNVAPPTSPVFMWSNGNHLSGKNVQVLETISSDELRKMLGSLVGVEGDQHKLISDAAPSLVVVANVPELRTDVVSRHGASFPFLQSALATSTSSASLHYVVTEEFNKISHSLASLPHVEVVHAAARPVRLDSNTVSFKELKELVKSGDFPSTEAQTTVLMLDFKPTGESIEESMADMDAKVSEITTLLAESPKGKDMVGLMTSGGYATAMMDFEVTSTRLLGVGRRLLSRHDGETEVVELLFTPAVIQGTFVMLVLAIIIFPAICCMCDIQVPLKIEGGKK